MSLKDDLNKIGENLLAELDGLQSEFTKFEADQEAARAKFLETQEKELQAKRDDLTKRDAEARENAEKETAAAVDAADKLIADALEKDQAAQNEAIAAAGDDKSNNSNGKGRTVNVR